MAKKLRPTICVSGILPNLNCTHLLQAALMPNSDSRAKLVKAKTKWKS